MVSNIPLIDIEQVSYSYPAATGNQVAALHEVSLRIECGEYVALLGHNGSGKSTLARHCNALLLPDSGRVLVVGNDTRDERRRREVRDRVGMIFQNPDNQIIATVVEDDVAWALAVRGLPAPLIRERVAWALAATGSASAWRSRGCWRCVPMQSSPTRRLPCSTRWHAGPRSICCTRSIRSMVSRSSWSRIC